jgi:hypothetical protein
MPITEAADDPAQRAANARSLDEERQWLLEARATGTCLLCETSIKEREPGEGITNGNHNYCLLANASGHVVRACRCYPDTEGMTDRQVAVLAFKRYRDQYGSRP